MARRAPRENQTDRLSDLPDCLIHHILSFMDTKFAVQTCVLSKKWKNLWTQLPTLKFCGWNWNRSSSFTKFVRRVLSQREPSNLRSLKFCGRKSDKSFVRRVTRYAVLHSVQEIDLVSLKHSLDYELFQNQLSRSVTLEKLFLNGFHEFGSNILKISAPRLLVLSLSDIYLHENEVVVSCPRLSSFRYQGHYPSTLSMNGCPVLDTIDIHLENYYSQSNRARLENLLQEVILHAKLLVVRMRTNGLKVKTKLIDGDVHAVIYNERTTESRELFWRAADQNFELFLALLMQRCDDVMLGLRE